MPFKHHSYYTSNREKARQTVNQWIRTSKAFDGVIDFDKIMRDPADSSSLHPSYQEDYLHPNEKGYQKMGESIDLSLFD
jgi:lysophospholipase L1-like esterase